MPEATSMTARAVTPRVPASVPPTVPRAVMKVKPRGAAGGLQWPATLHVAPCRSNSHLPAPACTDPGALARAGQGELHTVRSSALPP